MSLGSHGTPSAGVQCLRQQPAALLQVERGGGGEAGQSLWPNKNPPSAFKTAKLFLQQPGLGEEERGVALSSKGVHSSRVQGGIYVTEGNQTSLSTQARNELLSCRC